MSLHDALSVDGYLSFMLIALAISTTGLVVFYAEKGFPWHTYLTCILGYFCAFGILICVPVDIGSTLYNRQSTTTGSDPQYEEDVTKLSQLYTVYYVIIFILCGIVMCVEEYYNTDGYFTIAWKLISSVKRMLIDTILALILGVIILIVLIAKKVLPADSSALLLASVLLTNTVYETFLMFLLGYGLVSLPMTFWAHSDSDGRVLAIQNSVSASFKGLSEASFNVSEAVADVYKTKEALAGYGDMTLKHAMDILVGDCPSEFRSSTAGKVAANKEGKITIHTLAALRTRLNLLKDRFRMAKSHLEKIKRLAYDQEDISLASKRDDGAKTIFWSLRNKESTTQEYTWYVHTRPILYKLAAIVAAIFSLFSYLGVTGCMHDVSSAVSVYYMTVHDETATGGGLVVFVLITLGYTTYVTFWSLFQMRLAGLMEVVPFSTTPESLSFNVRMVARLASPLAFFYLGWLWESGIKYTTAGGAWQYNRGDPPIAMPSAFSKFYNIQVMPGLGDAFGTAFPVILFVVSGLTLTNLLNRIFVLCKLEAYQFGTEIVTEEQLKEGKRQLERHKKATARTVQRENLKDRINDLAGQDKTGVVSGVVATLLGGTKKKTTDFDAPAQIEEPVTLTSPVERKGGKNSFGLETGWKEEYATIRSPGLFCFFKDLAKVNSGLPPDFQVDLRLVLSFNEVSLGAKGESLVIDLPDSDVKLRFKSKDELTSWKNALIQWKDYAVDYADTHRNEVTKDETEETLSPFAAMAAKQGGGKKPNNYDLDSVEIGEFTETEAETKKKGGFLSGIFGAKKKENDGLDSIQIDSMPAELEGWLEKKTGSSMLGAGDWERKYCAIDDSTGQLKFYQTASKATSSVSNSIDLKLITDVSAYFDKKGGVTTRFNVTVDDKVFKFKVDSVQERDRWVNGITEWKDYFLMHYSSV